MALLDQAVAECDDDRRHAIMLAGITRIARISLEVDRLLVTVREGILVEEIRTILGVDVLAAVDAIAVALEEIVRELPRRIEVGVDNQPSVSRTRARLAMDSLSVRIIDARSVYTAQVKSRDIENFASFTDSLETLLLISNACSTSRPRQGL
jgi:hypothetical protein